MALAVVPLAAGHPPAEMGGLSGFVLDVVGRLGEIGIGLLLLVETVFPPIPSEVILPLGGYLAERGELNVAGVFVAATAGSLVGALILYWAGMALGLERSTALLARLPLVDREDVEKAGAWFERHGDWAVLIGRLIPGVRSLISLPAGAARMGLLRFSVLTLIGSAVWNGLLIGAGLALGTQWQLVEEYQQYFDYAIYAALVGVVVWLVLRRVRKVRRSSPDVRESVRQ